MKKSFMLIGIIAATVISACSVAPVNEASATQEKEYYEIIGSGIKGKNIATSYAIINYKDSIKSVYIEDVKIDIKVKLSSIEDACLYGDVSEDSYKVDVVLTLCPL